MRSQTLLNEAYAQVLAEVERALDGLSKTDLLKQPDPDSNSIGWLVWHLTRIQDFGISKLAGEKQLWITEGWHKKFKRKADPRDVGSGHDSAEVAAFQVPDAETLLGYLRAVAKRTEKYINSLSAADLDRKVEDSYFKPPPSVCAYLIGVLSDNLQHAGQAGYVRGLLKGKGWQPY